MKICPNCSDEHEKAGKFCSRSCANKRVWSTEDKLKKSIAASASTKVAVNASRRRQHELSWKDRRTLMLKSGSEELKAVLREAQRKVWDDPNRRAAASKTAKDRGFGGITSRHTYKYFNVTQGVDVCLQSSYEIQVAQSLDENNISWIRPAPLVWVDEQCCSHKYYPDFYLPDYNIYLDPKNSYLITKDKDKIQRVVVQNNVIVHVLKENQLTWEFILTLL